MIIIVSAAYVGFIHSLAPGHWLPVILMAKARKWPLKTALIGAMIAALGHIVLSIILGAITIWVGHHFFSEYEAEIERYAGLGLAAFGLTYAVYSYFRHSSCHGHTHHGPDPRGQKTPFLFLFTLGFSPCIAVLPSFVAAAAEGAWVVTLAFVTFSLGVLLSLLGATWVGSLGLLKLDHPILEHFGDVLTGAGVVILGLLLYLFPH